MSNVDAAGNNEITRFLPLENISGPPPDSKENTPSMIVIDEFGKANAAENKFTYGPATGDIGVQAEIDPGIPALANPWVTLADGATLGSAFDADTHLQGLQMFLLSTQTDKTELRENLINALGLGETPPHQGEMDMIMSRATLADRAGLEKWSPEWFDAVFPPPEQPPPPVDLPEGTDFAINGHNHLNSESPAVLTLLNSSSFKEEVDIGSLSADDLAVAVHNYVAKHCSCSGSAKDGTGSLAETIANGGGTPADIAHLEASLLGAALKEKGFSEAQVAKLVQVQVGELPNGETSVHVLFRDVEGEQQVLFPTAGPLASLANATPLEQSGIDPSATYHDGATLLHDLPIFTDLQQVMEFAFPPGEFTQNLRAKLEAITNASDFIDPGNPAVQALLGEIFPNGLEGMSPDQIAAAIHNHMLSQFSLDSQGGDEWSGVDATLLAGMGTPEDLANLEASLLLAGLQGAGLNDAQIAERFSVRLGNDGDGMGSVQVLYTDDQGVTRILDPSVADRSAIGIDGLPLAITSEFTTLVSYNGDNTEVDATSEAVVAFTTSQPLGDQEAELVTNFMAILSFIFTYVKEMKARIEALDTNRDRAEMKRKEDELKDKLDAMHAKIKEIHDEFAKIRTMKVFMGIIKAIFFTVGFALMGPLFFIVIAIGGGWDDFFAHAELLPAMFEMMGVPEDWALVLSILVLGLAGGGVITPILIGFFLLAIAYNRMREHIEYKTAELVAELRIIAEDSAYLMAKLTKTQQYAAMIDATGGSGDDAAELKELLKKIIEILMQLMAMVTTFMAGGAGAGAMSAEGTGSGAEMHQNNMQGIKEGLGELHGDPGNLDNMTQITDLSQSGINQINAALELGQISIQEAFQEAVEILSLICGCFGIPQEKVDKMIRFFGTSFDEAGDVTASILDGAMAQVRGGSIDDLDTSKISRSPATGGSEM